MANTNTQEPTVKKRAFMGLASRDLRRMLKDYPNLGDEWVKKQLQGMGKADLYFEGVADALRQNDVGTEASYKKIQKAGGPTETRGRGNTTDITRSIKRRMEKYGDLPQIKDNPDEYVKSQLQKANKGDYFYPGVAEDIRAGRLSNSASYFGNTKLQDYLAVPGNEEAKNRVYKQQSQPYAQKISNLTPEQQQLQSMLVDWAKKASQQYEKIGQPVPLEGPVNELVLDLLKQYKEGRSGDKYLNVLGNGPEVIRQGLSALGSGAQQAAQTLNPYLQNASNTAQNLASTGLSYLNPKSYLNAAQPYAQSAMNLGGDILSSIRNPAISTGAQIMSQAGIDSILNGLKGRM